VPDRTYLVAVADGIGDPPGPSPPPAAARPHWWAVLAVSLSLMALVAAVSAFTRLHGPSRPHAVAARQLTTPATSEPTTAGPPVTATTGSPVTQASAGSGAPGPEPSTTTTTGPVGVTTGTLNGPSGSSPPVPSTAATAPAATAPAATAPAATPRVMPGYLESPDNVSASYPFLDGPGTLSVTATWNASVDLILTAKCDHQPRQESSGPSGLAMTAAEPAGGCTIVLAEAEPAPGPVSYELTATFTGS